MDCPFKGSASVDSKIIAINEKRKFNLYNFFISEAGRILEVKPKHDQAIKPADSSQNVLFIIYDIPCCC